jgi:glycosyltransferase involved in cell wall biosynthesis
MRLAIIGTVGLPARYGGFETLAANLVLYAERHNLPYEIDVYCSGRTHAERLSTWHGAKLRYVPLDANGPISPLYDFWSMLLAGWRGADAILVLGVSGTMTLPLLRLLTRSRYIVNVDGVEWRREKWNRLASGFLRFSEAVAARFAHVVIGDNQAIVDHIEASYGRPSVLIPYGGDHAADAAGMSVKEINVTWPGFWQRYALMLCRIEPENNVHVILNSFSHDSALPLVAVGNWEASDYGRELKQRYAGHSKIALLDPIFEPGPLHAIRNGAEIYIHGHSAGGTNPSLVEMMYLGKPVLAYDCVFNRYSTENRAQYFANAVDLTRSIAILDEEDVKQNGQAMAEVARRRYRWEDIGRAYFDLLLPSQATET